MAAFTAIQAVPITRELSPPALQRGEPHAQQRRHRSGPCTSRDGLIEDLQGLTTILRWGQSPSSSPQEAWIFFEAISNAAASARALSLRRSSCWSRLISR